MPSLAALGHEVELRGVLEGDALDEDALAVREADEVRTDLLLGLVGIGNVVEGLEVEGIPEVALRGDGAAHALEGIPFRVAHLAAFHAAPPFAVSVDDAFTRNADVRPLAGGNARYGLAVLQVRGAVGREEDDRIPLQVQVNMVLQGDGPGDENAGRHHEMPAALLLQGADRLLEGGGVVRDAVAYAAELRETYRVVRNHRQLRFRHFPGHGGRQVAVIGPVGAGPRSKGGDKVQKRKE